MEYFLYRGVNPDLYLKTKGILAPKTNNEFKYTFKFDGTIKYDGSAKFGNSEHNAVLRHELRQEGFPTSGISTTPHIDRAKIYAFAGGKYKNGFIYKIDRRLLEKYGVREYEVSEYLPYPSVPEDKEVILVAKDNGVLPAQIVVDVISIKS